MITYLQRNRIEKEREIVLRHGFFFFLNEVHKKILMENIDTMEQILQKNG